MSGDEDEMITGADVDPRRGKGWNPADETGQPRSLTRANIKTVYDLLIEKGHTEEATEIADASGTHQMGELAAKYSRKHLSADEKPASFPMRW